VHPQDRQTLRFDVLTLFPDMFGPALESSILGIARRRGLVEYRLHDIRHYSPDKHRKVDERPYGGGPGMVMRCEPVFNCYEAVSRMAEEPGHLLLLTPQGRTFDQRMASRFARERRIIILCGRYEGFDERIRQGLPAEEVSIGDYVLSGGEAAALVIIDATVRLVPGVLGHDQSAAMDSFAGGLLEHPQYTRPPRYRGMEVPEVLQSGDHGQIEKWRAEKSRERTRARRKDLIKRDKARTPEES
jgi:tRNA (guanine37-N1)-methyltransferase